jgi:hypothetical protein
MRREREGRRGGESSYAAGVSVSEADEKARAFCGGLE